MKILQTNSGLQKITFTAALPVLLISVLVASCGLGVIIQAAEVETESDPLSGAVMTQAVFLVTALASLFLARAPLRAILPTFADFKRLLSGRFWGGLLLVACALFLVSVVMTVLFRAIGVSAPPQEVLTWFQDGKGLKLLALAVMVCVVAPIVEEFFFRFILLNMFSEYFGRFAGLFFSSLIFSLIHGNLYAALPLFLLGWAFGWIYFKTESVWAAVAWHGAFNFLSLLMTLLGGVDG